MKQISVVKTVLKLVMVGVTGLLVACGGGGSSSSSTDASISGTIVAAPVNDAQVSVVDGNGNVVAGPVNTNATGQYTLTIPDASLAQDLIVKSTGGTFTDEATGNQGITAGNMFAYASANSLSDGSSVSATPGSTIIANLVMNHNKTLIQAQEAFANTFGYTPDITINPADVTGPGADATEASKLAGFRAAAFSELALELGLMANQQFDMLDALAQDLSDDALDGVDASGVVAIGATGFSLEADIQNRFAHALANFHNSVYNLTGLTNDQIGNVPFAKVALTTNYQIEYEQIGMMGAMEGKTTSTLRVIDRNNAAADTSGLTLELMPEMHMATMTHSSPKPVTAVIDNGDGTYTATIYYLMASQMMDGTSMGYWDLKFTVDGEEAHFYPTVMMAMGDTVKTQLKGQTDVIKDMMGMDENRSYFIFKDDLTGMGPYTFTMFIAAKEHMMSFPAVLVPGTLQSDMMGMAPELNVSTVLVEVSDNDGVDWITATTTGTDGIWNATGLSLTDGVEDQIRVRLTVNDPAVDGEMKTIDGEAPGVLVDSEGVAILDLNGNSIPTTHTFFTVTPGMSM